MKRSTLATAAATAALAVCTLAGITATPVEAAPSTSSVSVQAAGPVSRCLASPIKDTKGPGLRNWRAYDPFCNGGGSPGKWWGPWRFTKGGATIDAERHNVQML